MDSAASLLGAYLGSLTLHSHGARNGPFLFTIERVWWGWGWADGKVMTAPSPCSRAFEQIDLDWIRADMPHLTCRGDSAFLQGAQMDNPLPRICQEWFALDRKERWRIAFEKQQLLNKTVHLCLGLIHRTRPWAEGGGWLLTSHRPWKARGPHC